MFIAQKAYLAQDKLRNVLCYPNASADNTRLTQVLQQVGLPQLMSLLDEQQNWAQMLSGGEQQRIAFARILLNQPDWLCVDEITNQLDPLSARYLLGLIRQQLPQMAVLAITHQPEAFDFDLTVEVKKLK